MRTYAFLPIVAAVAACGSNSTAKTSAPQERAPSQAATSTASWEVADIKLGMSDKQVEAALSSRGYSINKRLMGHGFAQNLAESLGQRAASGNPNTAELGASKGVETVSVKFVPFKSGPILKEVIYSTPVGQLSGLDALAAMIKRAGTPKVRDESGGHWCTSVRGAPSQCDHMKPRLFVGSVTDHTSILMDAGMDLLGRAEAEVATAAKNSAKPASF